MNPILLNIPTSIETDRLHLRKPFPGDGEDIYSFLTQQTPEITIEDAERTARELHIQFLSREFLPFHIYVKENNLFIGMISIKPINWEIPYVQIKYSFDENYLHNDYELESLRAMKYYAKHTLHSNRIEIQCTENDQQGNKIIEQAGFHLEGILLNHQFNNNTNEISNTCIYS